MTGTARHVVWATVALTVAMGGWIRVAAQTQPPPKIKTVEAHGFVGIEGKATYMAYCASCHGEDAKGTGPAAPALKLPVPDLTTMAQRHGSFDRIAVERTISGADKRPIAHGSMTMPIWGPVFASTGDRTTTLLRLQNLTKYLETLQAK